MTRHIEDRIDDIERRLSVLGAKHDRTLPSGINGRLERLEGIVEFLFKKAFSALQREAAFVKLKGAALKKRKAKPAKRRRPTRSRS